MAVARFMIAAPAFDQACLAATFSWLNLSSAWHAFGKNALTQPISQLSVDAGVAKQVQVADALRDPLTVRRKA
jgi:hypothetical protein